MDSPPTSPSKNIVDELRDQFDLVTSNPTQQPTLLKTIKELLKKDKKKEELFSKTDKSGKTVLHLVAERSEFYEILELLLASKKVKQVINYKDRSHKTALASAAKTGDEKLFTRLLTFVIEHGGEIDQAAFNFVCRSFCSSSAKDSLDKMLKHGKGSIDVNGVDDKHETPLHLAALNSKSIPVQGLYGANIFTKWLLDHGANPNVLSKKGETPLHHAVNSSNETVTKMLLFAGADPTLKREGGVSALELADQLQRPFRASIYIAKDMQEILKPLIFTPEETYSKVLEKFIMLGKTRKDFIEVTKERLETEYLFKPATVKILIEAQQKVKRTTFVKPVVEKQKSAGAVSNIAHMIENSGLLTLEDLFNRTPLYYKRQLPDTTDTIPEEGTLRVRTKRFGLKKKDVKNDPDCLFVSVAKFVSTNSMESTKLRAQEIRRTAIEWLQKNQIFDYEEYLRYRASKDKGSSFQQSVEKQRRESVEARKVVVDDTYGVSPHFENQASAKSVIREEMYTVSPPNSPTQPPPDNSHYMEANGKSPSVQRISSTETLDSDHYLESKIVRELNVSPTKGPARLSKQNSYELTNTNVFEIDYAKRNRSFKDYCTAMMKGGIDGCYGDFWMLIGICEAYSSKVCLITSEEGSRYCAVLVPCSDIKHTIILRAHLRELFFDALVEKINATNMPSNWSINPSDVKYFTPREFLGDGSQGTVEKAIYLGGLVAVKRRDAQESDLQSCFERELNAMMDLRHQNIVQFRGYYFDPTQCVYMVTELLEHGSLFDFIHKKPVESSTILSEREGLQRIKIAKNIASAMDFVHKKGFIHGDLTSKNVLLDENYKAKVGDFGLIRPIDYPLNLIGHRWWAAPEYLHQVSLPTEKIDIYSFGIICWELFTLNSPGKYQTQPREEFIRDILEKHVRPPIPKICPAKWKTLIEDCWNQDPSQRPSFEEILKQLTEMEDNVNQNRKKLKEFVKNTMR